MTEGKLGEAPLPPQTEAKDDKVPAAAASVREPQQQQEEEEEDLTEMQSRLQALRS